jgi:hypothetical protein
LADENGGSNALFATAVKQKNWHSYHHIRSFQLSLVSCQPCALCCLRNAVNVL